MDVKLFVDELTAGGVDFFCGVPDSLLKSFCAYVTDAACSEKGANVHCSPSPPNFTSFAHVIAANEGGAIGLAAGHYLATGRMACVYMQNSGQGNAVNPLCSLADPDVYSIPMVLLVGWRGEPGVRDEPQHVKQGKVTVRLFETLGIPTTVLGEEKAGGESRWRAQVSAACAQALREKRPVALIVRKGLFDNYSLQTRKPDIATLPREQAIEEILKSLPADAVVVSTTGMISREVYETRERLLLTQRHKDTESSCAEGVQNNSVSPCLCVEKSHARDFLTVGSMGHASMIALGIAKAQPNRPVCCLDGDGASIMQMGNMAIVGQSGCGNLTHIVLNNAAHDSVGGQPTVGGAIDLKAIARACGYEVREKVGGEKKVGGESRGAMDRPVFVEVKVAKGARADLGRPKESPQFNKDLFMTTLASN